MDNVNASRRTRPARERSWLRYVPGAAPEPGTCYLGGGTRAVLLPVLATGARYRRSLPGLATGVLSSFRQPVERREEWGVGLLAKEISSPNVRIGNTTQYLQGSSSRVGRGGDYIALVSLWRHEQRRW